MFAENKIRMRATAYLGRIALSLFYCIRYCYCFMLFNRIRIIVSDVFNRIRIIVSDVFVLQLYGYAVLE